MLITRWGIEFLLNSSFKNITFMFLGKNMVKIDNLMQDAKGQRKIRVHCRYKRMVHCKFRYPCLSCRIGDHAGNFSLDLRRDFNVFGGRDEDHDLQCVK